MLFQPASDAGLWKSDRLLGNYALLLNDILKKPNEAGAMLKRALEVEPGNASILGEYKRRFSKGKKKARKGK